MKPTLLILAAGMGSRYGGLKQVDPVGPNGEAIIDYSIYDAIRAGFGKVVFVIRESFAEAFKTNFEKKLAGKIQTEYVYQELESFVPDSASISPERKKPWGTGHAVLVARDVVNEPFVVINADDFYGPESYRLIQQHLSGAVENEYCMVGYRLDKTLSDHGYVSRGVCQTDGHGYLQTVVERTHIEKVNRKIISEIDENTRMEMTGHEVVSMNIWGFTPSYFDYLETFFNDFIQKNTDNPQGEFYIPFVVNELISNKEIKLKVLESEDQWFGITYREDKDLAINSIQELIKQKVYPPNLLGF